jgi:hypothetical protein
VIQKFRTLRAGAPANRGRTRQEMQPLFDYGRAEATALKQAFAEVGTVFEPACLNALTPPGGADHHRDGLVQVLHGEDLEVTPARREPTPWHAVQLQVGDRFADEEGE